MKLINAEKLKQHYAWWDDDRQKLFDEIVDQQKAVEAVPVIRCKDCRYSDTYPASGEIHEMPLKCLGIRYGGVMPDWYCEHAERKEE